jgi:protein-tyrosine phosphatase
MAEAVLRQRFEEARLGSVVVVDSAGTAGWHVGDDADPRARRALDAAGYQLQHRARRFQSDWFWRTDLVLAMDAANLDDLKRMSSGQFNERIRLLRSFDPLADSAEVPDPYYGGMPGFTEVLRMIESAAGGVVDFVSGQLPGVSGK